MAAWPDAPPVLNKYPKDPHDPEICWGISPILHVLWVWLPRNGPYTSGEWYPHANVLHLVPETPERVALWVSLHLEAR